MTQVGILSLLASFLLAGNVLVFWLAYRYQRHMAEIEEMFYEIQKATWEVKETVERARKIRDYIELLWEEYERRNRANRTADIN